MYQSDDPKVIAQSLINQAMGSYNSGDNYDAQVNLARAIQVDKSLMWDETTRDFAAKITGLTPEAAIARLTTPAKDKSRNGASSERTDRTGRTGRTGGSDEWFVVLIEAILVFAVIMFATMVFQGLLRQSAALILPKLETSVSQVRTRANLTKFINETQGTAVLAAAASTGASTLASIMVWNLLVYAFSTMALGGVGGLLAHISVNLRIQIVSTLLFAVTAFIFFGSLTGPTQMQPGLAQFALVLLIANTLGTIAAQCYFVSRVHDFDLVRGFTAVVLSPFILSCGLCALLTVANVFT